MNSEEIIKMAFELGNVLAQSDEIEGVKALQAKVTENKDAYDLIMRYQDARTKMDNKLKDGLLISKPEEDHINILEQQLNNNALIKELMTAQEKFNNLMQAVYFAMNQAMSGNCSAGCESCGGCGI